MSSKLAVENFLAATFQWTSQTIRRVRATWSIMKVEQQTALKILNDHSQHLRYNKINARYAEEIDQQPTDWESLLNDLHEKQLVVNEKLYLYEIAPYPIESNLHKLERGVPSAVFTLSNDSMVPGIFPGDQVTGVEINPADFAKAKGLVALAYRYDKTHPRTWVVGRVEPVRDQLIRLTHDNTFYGHDDRALPLRQVVMMYKLQRLQRDLIE